ncbi:hypothetical protein ACT80S_10640 [Ramlibacter sp. MAHUQ-53]|uniref:hypothetical protein n=1 Tax=unclassified Ramlibacter TaxID=2617605 RepID=UPI00362AFDFE
MVPPGSKPPHLWRVPPVMGLAGEPDSLGLPPSSPTSPGRPGARAVVRPGDSRELRAARDRLARVEQALVVERERFPGPAVTGEPFFSGARELAAERVAHASHLLKNCQGIEAAVRRPLLDGLPGDLVTIVSDDLDIHEGRSFVIGACAPRLGGKE